MEKEQAINVLIQVANLAQERGLLKLQDAVVVIEAIKAVESELPGSEKLEVGGGVLVSPRH